MSQLEQFAEVGNGRENNKRFTIDAGDSVTCHFEASGSDSATAKYYNLRASAMRCAILANNASELTHINGHELDSPLTLTAALWNSWTKGIRWSKITIRATSDSTSFEVYAY